MKNNYYKIGIIISMIMMFIFVTIIRNINLQKEIYTDSIIKYNNSFNVKEVLNKKALRQFGYIDIFESIKINDKLRIVKFEKVDSSKEKLSVLLEFAGDIEELRKIINILKYKENFSKISKMIIKNGLENPIIIEVELKFGII